MPVDFSDLVGNQGVGRWLRDGVRADPLLPRFVWVSRHHDVGSITNEAGSWTGSTVGVIRPEDGIAWRTWDQFTGSGAYEGLSVMLDKESNGEFEGVIVPGPLPDGE